MSKTIESFKKPSFREDLLHGHIADTYFYQKTYKKKSKNAAKKIRVIFAASSLFVIAFLAIVFSLFLHNSYIKFLEEKTANSKIIKIFDEGHLNKEILKKLEFRGYAKGKSKFANKIIVLNNSKKYNWADFSLDFKFPIDFSKRSLSLTLRGKIGGERINIVLRDVNNRSYRLSDIYLVSNWNTEIIPFNDVRENIDLSKITHLRFECGYAGESDKKMDSLIDVIIHIKGIQILKEV